MTKIIKTINIKNISNQLISILYTRGNNDFGVIPKNDSGILQLNSVNNSISLELSRVNLVQLENLKKKELIIYEIINSAITVVNKVCFF